MGRVVSNSIENSFVKGLITEATGLNYPENASEETFNCIFLRTGEVKRRPGFNREEGAVFHSVDDDLTAVAEFVWTNAGNLGQFAIVVQQIGTELHFFRVSETNALSAGKLDSIIDLADMAPAGAPISPANGEVCQFAIGNGVLFVAHPFCNPFYLSYDIGSDTVSATELRILIRDFRRLDDKLAIDERPTTLTNAHLYNLFNQGWYARNGAPWTLPVINLFTELP
jgi:hypothetical protein